MVAMLYHLRGLLDQLAGRGALPPFVLEPAGR
jgi:hypothetical protein